MQNIRKLSSNPKYREQVKTVYEVTAKYWNQDVKNIEKVLASIQVLNRTGSKIVSAIPNYGEFPQCICKIYFSGDGFQNEIKGNLAVNSFIPVKSISTPQVIKYYPENQAILTEKLKMRDSRLDLIKIFHHNQNVNWKDVGLWLRNFHDSGIDCLPDESFLQQKLSRFDDHISRLTPLFKSEHLKKMEKIKHAAVEHFMKVPCKYVLSHGDFGIGNIKISNSTTYIIDFENVRMLPKDYEVVNFLSGIQSTIYFIYRQKSYIRLCDHFSSGYGLQVVQNPQNDFFYLLAKLDIIANCLKQLAKKGISPGKVVYSNLQRSVTKTVRDYLDQNQQYFPIHE